MESTATKLLENSASSMLRTPFELSKISSNPLAVGSAWVVSSALFSTYTTTSFLKYDDKKKDLPAITSEVRPSIALDRPTLLTLYRFTGSLLFGIFIHPQFTFVFERIARTISTLPDFFLPATFLFIANFTNSIALNRIGISLTYTSKCGIPLVTVLLTCLLDGKDSLPSAPTLLCLLPIAFGIAAASWNSPCFELLGFVAALVSCISQVALNVSCKRVLSRLGVGGFEAQRSMAAVGLAYTLSLSLYQLLAKKKNAPAPPRRLSIAAALSYHLEYCLSFAFVGVVEPITFGTCDAMRRLLIIIAGRKMFGGAKYTSLNLMGIILAVGGAVFYAIVKGMS